MSEDRVLRTASRGSERLRDDQPRPVGDHVSDLGIPAEGHDSCPLLELIPLVRPDPITYSITFSNKSASRQPALWRLSRVTVPAKS